jgi:hypothetical protein
MKTKPQGGPQHMAHCEYNISCVYGRNYAAETTQTASYTASGAKAESETW